MTNIILCGGSGTRLWPISRKLMPKQFYKLFDNKKFFEIIFYETIDKNEKLFISQIIEDSFDMNKKIKLKKPIIDKKGIIIDCEHSSELASIKIEAKDQKALFAYIAKIFDDFQIDIESAKIFTHKNRIQDLILIQKNGNFCPNREIIINLLS